MTAAANKKLIQKIFDGLAQGDRALFRAHMADDFRILVTGRSSWSRRLTTAAEISRYYAYVRSRFRDPGKTVPERFIADGDLVAVEARGDNVAVTGERYDNDYCLVFELRDGKIVEMREYMDHAFCERVLGPYPAAAS